MRQSLERHATTHATETGTFAKGSYITDPLRYVSVLCAQATFIAVGGDCGRAVARLLLLLLSTQRARASAVQLGEATNAHAWRRLVSCSLGVLVPSFVHPPAVDTLLLLRCDLGHARPSVERICERRSLFLLLTVLVCSHLPSLSSSC